LAVYEGGLTRQQCALMTPFELREQISGIRYRRKVRDDEIARLASWLMNVWLGKGARRVTPKKLLGRAAAETFLPWAEVDSPRELALRQTLRDMIKNQERRDKEAREAAALKKQKG